MAKLTARFGMEDRITKKLKAVRGELDSVAKARDKINNPMILKVKDNATKTLKTVGSFVKKDIAKIHTIRLSVNDRASKPLRSLSNFLERRFPKTHEILVRAQDKARTVLENIRRYLQGNILGAKMFTVLARDRAMPVLHSIANYARRTLARGYNFTVRAIDVATRTVSRIASFARTAIPAYRNFTIRAINAASNVIGRVRRALFSIPTMITVGLAVVGLGSLNASTLGAAMNFEGYRVSMEHWLDGDTKQADELIGWMGRFADSTPFSSADLFPALSRGIGVSNGDIRKAQSLLEIASNMSALTPNRTVEDAMEALASAQMGEFQLLKGYNIKMDADQFDSLGGWSGFLHYMDKTFEDGAKKFSQTASGQISTIKGYTSTLFREAGVGVLESMKPRLNTITNWLDNNQEKWGEWKNTVQQAGEQGAEWVLSKLEGAFSYIRDNYLENDEFKKLDFEGKIKFIMSDLKEWWDNTGLPLLSDVGLKFGQSMYEGMIWGVKEGVKGIGGMWKEAFDDPSPSKFGGAALATAFAGSILSLVLSPLVRLITGTYKVGKWGFDKGKSISGWFSKGKTPTAAPIPTKSPIPKPLTPKQMKPVYTQPWFNKGQKVKLNVPNAGKNKGLLSLFGGLGKIKVPGWLGKSASGASNFLKKVPVLGTVLGALNVMTAEEGERSKATGQSLGALGGAKAGAAIGILFGPGIGTAIGGVIGSIIGSFGGGKIGQWFKDLGISDAISNTVFNKSWWSDQWSNVKEWSSSAWENTKEVWDNITTSISDTLFNGEWWSGKWNGIKELTTSTIFSAGWWAEQAGFVYGYLESTLFSGEWWSEKWAGVTEYAKELYEGSWLEKTLVAIGGTIFSSEWWQEKWESVKNWTKEKWDSAVEIWNSVLTMLSETIFNGDWWSEKWQDVKNWTSEKWESFTDIWNAGIEAINNTIFNGEWWMSRWEDVTGWTSEKWESAKTIWSDVKSAISETLFSKDWWTDKWNSVVNWGKEIMGGIGGWVSGLIEDTKERFGVGREKGQDAASNSNVARNSNGRNRNAQTPKYANGGLINRAHVGLVGEAGPEMIIPLSANRRSRALELFTKTAGFLGVNPYANGGFVGSSSVSTDQVNSVLGTNSSGVTTQSKREVVVQFNGDQHFYTDEDSENFVEKVKKSIEQILKDEHNEGGEMVVYG